MSIRFANPAETRKEEFRRRFRIFCFALTLGYFFIVGRGVVLMLQDNTKLETMALKQYRAAIQKESERGRILDVRGKELAINIPAWSVYADPKEIEDLPQTVSFLSKVLDLPAKTLRAKLLSSKRFVWIKRKCSADVLEKLLKEKPAGIYTLKESMRSYPQAELAGNILGAVGIDSQALGGMELAYNSFLASTPSTGTYLRDARGKLYLASLPVEAEEHPQADLYLTLDKNIQFFAEQALRKAVQAHQAKGGAVLVMDPSTGALLAMADEPSASFENWRNHAVTDVYEPGSTFKPIFLSAALEEGKVALDEKVYCERGNFEVIKGHTISDHHPYDWLTVREVIKVSSNIGAYKIASRLGKKAMYAWVKAFGFGQKAGIDFPGETVGLLRNDNTWDPLEEATIAFGQGIGVTPLQMISAYATIANGGIRMKPHLVEKIVTRDGNIVYQSEPEEIGRPISPETAQRVTQVLREVVQEGGTAPLAAMKEYPVAGKTGTAQKAALGAGGYMEGKYIASFIGFAPVPRPKLAALVLIDEPRGSYYGGVVAAPVFHEVMLHALQYLGLAPEGNEKNVWTVRKEIGPKEMEIPTLQKEGSYFKVPDFSGSSLRRVLKAVTAYPVAVELKGRGVASKQWPKPGTAILAGSKIYVEFEPLYQ